MTDDQINAAIAAVYGWEADYCGCLNAMREAERSLENPDLYESRLEEACGGPEYLFFASARQRAEAFLRTLGKWENPVVKERFTTEGKHLRGVTKMVWEVQS